MIYGDDIEIKGIKAGTAQITAALRNTNLKVTYSITVTKAVSTDETALKNELARKIRDIKIAATKLRSTIKNTIPKGTRAECKVQYLYLERQIDTLDNQLDVLEDRIEDLYDSGQPVYYERTTPLFF